MRIPYYSKMKRLVKIFGILAATAAALVVVLVLSIKVFLPPEKVRSLIETQLTEKLNRQTKLGAVSVGLFSGLRVDHFSLSDRPTFESGTFVSSDEMQVHIALLPLLARKVVVHNVKLVNPSVRIVRFPDGKFNFSDLSGTGTEKPASMPEKKESSSLQVIVTGISLTGGKLVFEDRMPGGRSVTIDPLNASVRNLTLTGNADVQTTLGLKTNGVTANLDFAGDVNVLKGSVSIRTCRVTSGDSALSVQGRASELNLDPMFDLKVAIEELSLPLIAKLAPDAAAYKPTGQIAGAMAVNGKSNGFTFDGTLDLASAGFAVPDTFSKAAGKPMTVFAKGRLDKMSTLKLDEFKLTLGSLKTSASGEIKAVTESTRTFALALRTDPFPVIEVLSLFPKGTLPADVSVGGNAALTARVNGNAAASQIDFSLDAGDSNIAYGQSFKKPAGVPLTVSGKGRFSTPMAVHLDSLDVLLAGMTLAGTADYKSGSAGAWSTQMKSGSFAVAPVAALAPAASDYSPSGTATIDLTARSTANSPDVKGKFTLNDGSAKYGSSAFTQIATGGSFTMDSVLLPTFKAKLNGAAIAMKLNAKNLETHPDIQADIDAAELDLSSLIPKESAPKKTDAAPFRFVEVAEAADMMSLPMDISGSLKAARVKHAFFDGNNLDIVWKLTGVTTAMDKISGTAKLKHGKGEIRNLQKLTADSRAAKLLFTPITMIQKINKATGGTVKLPPMDQVPFTSINGDYTFTNGVMKIVSFVLDGPAFNAATTGTVGLAGNQPVNTRVTFTLPAGSVGGSVAEILSDGSGRVSLVFNVTGTVSDPSPALDKKDAEKKVLNAVKSGAFDGALKSLGLPGFSRPKQEQPAQPATAPTENTSAPAQQAAPAQPAQKSAQDKQLEDAQELLRGLFKRR